MPVRQQPRRISRELALLSLSQIGTSPEHLAEQILSDLVLAAIRTLTMEMRDTLEAAAEEVKRGSEQLLNSQTRASSLESARVMVGDAIEMTQAAINTLGVAIDLPEFVQLANQQQVRDYTLDIMNTVHRRREEIDQLLDSAIVDWRLNRLPRIDRDILRIAVAEMSFLQLPDRVAINEAVELAKRYSDDEGKRFINGVLRRVVNQIKNQSKVLANSGETDLPEITD